MSYSHISLVIPKEPGNVQTAEPGKAAAGAAHRGENEEESTCDYHPVGQSSCLQASPPCIAADVARQPPPFLVLSCSPFRCPCSRTSRKASLLFDDHKMPGDSSLHPSIGWWKALLLAKCPKLTPAALKLRVHSVALYQVVQAPQLFPLTAHQWWQELQGPHELASTLCFCSSAPQHGHPQTSP